MTLTRGPTSTRASESAIIEFVTRDFGHFLLATDDRIFVNVFRRTIITELGLPSTALTVVTSDEQLLKVVKEFSVKKKRVLLFVQTVLGSRRIDELIRLIAQKVRNCTVVIVTTESELNHLALLREQKVAENWIVKPVVINQLLQKVAAIIKPHGGMGKLFKAAEDFLAQGEHRHALIVCRKIFEVSPDNPVAYMLMGDAFKGLDQEEEMVRAYEQAAYVDELFFEPIQKLIGYFTERGDKERAVHYMEKMDVLSPLNMDRKMQIAKLHLELGHADDARGNFDNVMKMTYKKVRDTISETATRIARIYQDNGNPEAEVFLRKAIEAHEGNLDRSHMHLFNNLGIYLRQNKKWKEAVEVYKEAILIDPKSEALYYNIALAYDDGGDVGQAVANMASALRVNPEFHKTDCVVAYNIALIYSKAKAWDEALEFAKCSLASNPDYECARSLLQTLTAARPEA